MEKTTANTAAAAIGIDLAKKVFQVHAINLSGEVVVRRAVKRRELLAEVPQGADGLDPRNKVGLGDQVIGIRQTERMKGRADGMFRFHLFASLPRHR